MIKKITLKKFIFLMVTIIREPPGNQKISFLLFKVVVVFVVGKLSLKRLFCSLPFSSLLILN